MNRPWTATVLFLFLTSLGETADILPPVSERFHDRRAGSAPDFQKHIVPMLGRLGCNAAKCHGSFQGQAGFRLSLFGFDFPADHKALISTASSGEQQRLDPEHPETSLIVLKALGERDHGGGQRLRKDSWERNLMLRWIETGAKPARLSRKDAVVKQSEVQHAEFFRETVQPILENHCFECHGFNSRKGNLSLGRRDGWITGGDRGPAGVPGRPAESLVMQVVSYSQTLQMPPSGKLKDAEIEALGKWIELGMPWPDSGIRRPSRPGQTLVTLRTEPGEILFDHAGQTQNLRIVAIWEDGTREDVTCLCRFQSNDPATVKIDREGKATAVGSGDTHVVAFYDNGVAAIPVLMPYRTDGPPGKKTSRRPGDGEESSNRIDRFIDAKLVKLGLVASEPCSDAEFLRRVRIDLTGTLPTPDEVAGFLSDRSTEKRIRKIDELLKQPGYAAWWTNKLCDFTGCNPKSISSLLEVAREDGYVKASEWYDWIHERVENNEPYDRLVADLMLADPREPGKGMPYFWTRQSLKEPKDTAMSVAHSFLGIQLQCAECHKHPFDRWTQADFGDFSMFFETITRTKRNSMVKVQQELDLLRSARVKLNPGDDPRKPVVDWMLDPANPWFARAFVNRVWAGYFHVGLVEPPDQFTPANPASHPGLLEWLSDEFVRSGFDMKWLHRQIVGSRAYQRSWRPNGTNQDDRRNFSRSIPRRVPAEVVYDAMKQATARTDRQVSVRRDLRRRASGYLSMRMAGTHAMNVFGKPDRSTNCDCERVNEPTLLQAIFTQNDPLVRLRIADSGWIVEIEDALAEGQVPDRSGLIRQVWLRTVGRYPTDAEHRRADAHLDSVNSLPEGIGDLLWAMMNTKEFLLNH